MKQIDLNCDMGELLPGQKSNFDADIMPFISSCNIACGFHSGDPLTIEKTIKEALEQNVSIGAHPSYNDREHFGRKSLQVDPSILSAEIRYQISALKTMVESLGGKLTHVKPHGALYNDMVNDKGLAQIVLSIIKAIDPSISVLALAGSQVIQMGQEMNLRMVNEGFADRRYQEKTQLRSRKLENAVISEKTMVIEQIKQFTEGRVSLYGGKIEELEVESICLHSDTEGAVQLSKAIYEFLKSQDVLISAH